jgi:hypothetical protein
MTFHASVELELYERKLHVCPVRRLSTAREVVAAFGAKKLQEMFGVGVTAVSNWRVNGLFPGYTALSMKEALNAAGFDAPSDLWKSSVKSSKRSPLREAAEAAQ